MNILLVEDNPADARLVREALAECKLPPRLQWVADGEKALEVLRLGLAAANEARTDLVLLDLNLPGLHGLEVLKEIKNDPALLHIPVVVLTSSEARQDVLAAYGAHVNSYVVKPNNFDEFLALVDTIHGYWADAVLLPRQAG